DGDGPPEQVAGPDQAPGGRAEALGRRSSHGQVEGLQVPVEQLGQLDRDRRPQPEGAQVVAEGPVGVAGRGRVLEAAGLLEPGPAALDGRLGGRLESDRPLGQGEQGVTARRVGPGPIGDRRRPHGPQVASMVAMVAPVVTVWPSATSRPATVPAWWAVTWFSIFMASRTTRVW